MQVSDSRGKQGGGFGLTLRSRHIRGSLAGMRASAVIAAYRGIRAVRQQRLDDSNVAPVSCAVQGREAIPAAGVHFRTPRNQQLHEIEHDVFMVARIRDIGRRHRTA
jgi:hypothetical protein